jgi:hypothetical protein
MVMMEKGRSRSLSNNQTHALIHSYCKSALKKGRREARRRKRGAEKKMWCMQYGKKVSMVRKSDRELNRGDV